MRGYAHKKHHALDHLYPSRAAIIEKYGYDPKQLMHLARYKEIIKDFALGKPFPDVLIVDNKDIEDYLRELKSGKFNVEAAKRIANEIILTADKYTNIILNNEPDADELKCQMIEEHLERDIADFIKNSLRQQFEGEK